MKSPVQSAVLMYIAAAQERDPGRRTPLLERCFAEDGRMVTRSREIRGRANLIGELDRFLSSPEVVDIRVTSAIDAEGTTFRYRAMTVFRNGQTIEVFDAGEIDESGKISLILTFAGPLGEPSEGSQGEDETK